MSEKNGTDVHWVIWRESDEPDANGHGRRWKLLCSICLRELEVAVNFPESGLRVCFNCVAKIHKAAINTPSG